MHKFPHQISFSHPSVFEIGFLLRMLVYIRIDGSGSDRIHMQVRTKYLSPPPALPPSSSVPNHSATDHPGTSMPSTKTWNLSIAHETMQSTKPVGGYGIVDLASKVTSFSHSPSTQASVDQILLTHNHSPPRLRGPRNTIHIRSHVEIRPVRR